jgi:hypothetical protein
VGLARLPKRSVTWFARGEYDRLLLTFRDQGRVIGLPLINGGGSQHMYSPYFPVPYSTGMLEGIANETIPQLAPRFTLADGSVLMPLAYFKDVKVAEQGARTTVTYRLAQMDKLGASAPRGDARITATTRYVFERGRITRTDTFTPTAEIAVTGVDLQLASFGETPTRQGPAFRYAGTGVQTFKARGFERCDAAPTAGDRTYQTPAGPLASVVTCRIGPRTLKGPITLSWTLTYG